MTPRIPRRTFLRAAAAGTAALAVGGRLGAQQVNPEHGLSVFSGSPRERGRAYGAQFKDGIRSFLDREILLAFTGKPNAKEPLLRYAAACTKEIRSYSPLILEEMEGMAEGSGLVLEDLVLVTTHEELWHRGLVPAVSHCTVFGSSGPDTRDGDTFVCQTWDWMESVYGLSSMLLWKRPEGPSVLAYAFPGLWAGAGMNSTGLSLCWHSYTADGNEAAAGIPAYVLIAQILYQDTLKGALEQVRRAKIAGWFSYLIGDAQGGLATIRGTPKKLEILDGAKANGGRVAAEGDSKVDLPRLQAQCGKVKIKSTIDSMIFNCTRKEAHVTRRAGGVTPWKKFTFEG